MERLAIDAGVNRMALPSDEAVSHARSYGLEVRYQATCCSVSKDLSEAVLEVEGKRQSKAKGERAKAKGPTSPARVRPSSKGTVIPAKAGIQGHLGRR